MDANQSKIYLNFYKSTPLDLELSFLSKMKLHIDSNDPASSKYTLFKSLGLALSNIDSAPVHLKALILRDVFGTLNYLSYLLTQHYTE